MKKITRERLHAWLAPYATEERILDIGAGTIDKDPLFPNRFTIDHDASCKPDLVADVHNLPFSDNEFQTILCREVLEHCIDPAKAVHEMMRVLKPGGTLLLTTRFLFPLHEAPHDYWRFTKYGLQHLFSDWKILEIKEETQPFSCMGVLLQRIVLQTRLKANKPSKAILRVFARALPFFDRMVVKEFGDIRKEHEETMTMSSGIYIRVTK